MGAVAEADATVGASGLGGRFVDVGDVDGDRYGGIDDRGGFGVSVNVLAVGDADGYGVGLRGFVVEAWRRRLR